jgi:hypothetical protein
MNVYLVRTTTSNRLPIREEKKEKNFSEQPNENNEQHSLPLNDSAKSAYHSNSKLD